MDLQWYPGHMTKARRMMQEDIKLVDLVIELLDARAPISSKNPDIDKMAGNNKSRVVILNKADLGDPKVNLRWKDELEKKGIFACMMDSRSRNGMREVNEIIEKACEKKFERDRKRGILRRPVRAMIAGIPNVGKSTFINSFAKKACVKTGNKPGVTKGKQWIKLNKDVELLDTPGILWPKFEDKSVGLHLAMIGSIKEEILNIMDLVLEEISMLQEYYPEVISEEMQMAKDDKPVSILNAFAEKRNCLGKGGVFDVEKAAYMFADDFRNGKMGRMSIERP